MGEVGVDARLDLWNECARSGEEAVKQALCRMHGIGL